MTVGILKEPQEETRVSLLPDAVASLVKKGVTVLVEEGAGSLSFASDLDYEAAGARIVNAGAIATEADVPSSIIVFGW